jgi:hypothetical protein
MNPLESLLEGYHRHSMKVVCELTDLAIEFLGSVLGGQPLQLLEDYGQSLPNLNKGRVVAKPSFIFDQDR